MASDYPVGRKLFETVEWETANVIIVGVINKHIFLKDVDVKNITVYVMELKGNTIVVLSVFSYIATRILNVAISFNWLASSFALSTVYKSIEN